MYHTPFQGKEETDDQVKKKGTFQNRRPPASS